MDGNALFYAQELLNVVRLFMDHGPTETDPDHCPTCYGEHHEPHHRKDCPYVAARKVLANFPEEKVDAKSDNDL